MFRSIQSRGMRHASGLSSLILLLAAMLLFAAPALGACVRTDDGFGQKSFVIYAGQDMDAGFVTVQVQGEQLLVEYRTTGSWTLNEVHLWLGYDAQGYPQTSQGNPIPGKFPYKATRLNGATSYEFRINLSVLPFSCPSEDRVVYMMAHAALQRINYDGSVQRETGWSEGDRVVERGNWATMSSFALSCECGGGGGGGDPRCETAFARDPQSNTCFIALGFSRWGWSNGPYSLLYDYRVLDLYAGAAQCDLSKGVRVGTVTLVGNSTTSASVLFETSGGWYMNGTHLYIGLTPTPMVTQGKKTEATVAPGQYPYIHGALQAVSSDRYDDLPWGEGRYLIAHADVCIDQE